MSEQVPTEPPAVTAAAATAAALIALAEHAPSRARAAMATALTELAPEDWAWLGLLYRGHAHSPNAALSRVLALAAARLGNPDTRPLDHWSRPATGVEVLEVPVEVEIRDWVRRPVREDCYDLRLHAEPSPATEAMRTTSEAIAARARRRPARQPGFETATSEGTGTGAHARLVA
ncbi:hypothetical protein [Nocardia asiatica]|uniref:hypothetical protein n=1 Tax=Nocardia asiatica TaxID=209252 RepID=UPI000310C2FD|nr:hypothetical protein [Nocardia asiatica]